MKKALFNISSILLFLISFTVFFHSYELFETASFLENEVPTTFSEHSIAKRIEEMEDKDKALSFALNELKNHEKIDKSQNDFTQTFISKTKDAYKEIAISVGVMTILSFILLGGVSSNNRAKSSKDDKSDDR